MLFEIERVKRNFRNINIVAQSFGAAFVQQIGDVLFDSMLAVGFTDCQIAEAVSQILVVSVGSAVNFFQSRSRFTYVHILHRHDDLVKQRTSNLDLYQCKIEQMTQEGQIKEESGLGGFACRRGDYPWEVLLDSSSNVMIIGTLDPNPPSKNYQVIDRSSGDYKIRDTEDELNHGADTYFNFSLRDSGFMLPVLIASVLTNGLNNSILVGRAEVGTFELPPIAELIKLPVQRFFAANFGRDFIDVGKGIGYPSRIERMLKAK